MFKITVTPAPTRPTTISSFNMKVGEIGRTTEDQYYLRTQNNVVCLNDPSVDNL